MTILYHIVPRGLVGTQLYPLNELEQTMPDIYAVHAQKYQGREALMESIIPPLNCRWNDVLHLSPVHPTQIRNGFQTTGFSWRYPLEWFEIDPSRHGFNAQNAVIYLAQPRERKNFVFSADDFIPYCYAQLRHLTEMPQANLDYYQQVKQDGGNPLLFKHVPHILFRGAIDIEGVNRICI